MNVPRLFSALFLLIVFIGALATLPMFRFRSLVLHHSATPGGNYASIKHGQKGRWFDMAYHCVLTNGVDGSKPGELQTGLRHFFMMHAAATKNKLCNFTGLHMCIAGNYEDGPLSDDMKIFLVSAIRAAQEKYGISDDRVKLHRDCSATACPGRHIDLASVRLWLRTIDPDPEILARHKKELSSDFLGPIPKGPLLVMLPVLLLLLVFRAPIGRRDEQPVSVSGKGDA